MTGACLGGLTVGDGNLPIALGLADSIVARSKDDLSRQLACQTIATVLLRYNFCSQTDVAISARHSTAQWVAENLIQGVNIIESKR